MNAAMLRATLPQKAMRKLRLRVLCRRRRWATTDPGHPPTTLRAISELSETRHLPPCAAALSSA